MPTAAELLAEIDAVLPPVPKPIGSALTFHSTGCFQCDFLRKELEEYVEPQLPDEALRWLRGELTLLSAQGLRWALPSYLRRCITQDAELDAMETEFLIYTMGPDAEDEEDAVRRLELFSVPQLGLLDHFLEWCAEHPHWSEYCPHNIATARRFVARLVEARGAA